MNKWTDGKLWALAERLSAEIEAIRTARKPPPVQAELPLGPGGNVIALRARRTSCAPSKPAALHGPGINNGMEGANVS